MRRRLPRFDSELTGALVISAIFFALICLGFWFQFAAPCEVYTFMNGAEIPGRCLMP